MTFQACPHDLLNCPKCHAEPEIEEISEESENEIYVGEGVLVEENAWAGKVESFDPGWEAVPQPDPWADEDTLLIHRVKK